MPMNPCSLCRQVLTTRPDGLCDHCAQARQLIEASYAQAVLVRLVRDCEKDWALMDRIDNDVRRRGAA